jgi:hypothetical protein
MAKYDNLSFNPKDGNYQDAQERQVAALRAFYPKTKSNLRKGTLDELFPPLDRGRLYGPFTADVVFWLMQISRKNSPTVVDAAVTVGIDAEGREYIEL